MRALLTLIAAAALVLADARPDVDLLNHWLVALDCRAKPTFEERAACYLAAARMAERGLRPDDARIQT
jgi:hypothetical protein